MFTIKFATNSPDKPEVDITVDGQRHQLIFNTSQQGVLEHLLGGEPIRTYFKSGNEREFLQYAITAGTCRNSDKLNPTKVGRWLDSIEDPEFDTELLAKEILYAIARGRRGKQAKKWLEILDDTYKNADGASGESPLEQPGLGSGS